MPTGRHSLIFQQLRQAVLAHDGAGLTDAELISHFVGQRDGAALEALIRRHGSMVWSVCRRVLSNEQDAEDAFQASFLVFVRKAASIRTRAQLGNWLYGVAYRTALKARSAEARRRAKERRAAVMIPTQTQTEESWTELLPLLDQELNRLPDKYRTALVLCELEGRPRKEAARQLGIPEGTLSSRLATGRRMLAKRLGCPGLALSAGAIAASTAVGPTLLASTVKAATAVAVDGVVVAGVVTVRVAALAEGVIKAMLLTRISAGVILLTVVAVLAAGTGTAVYSEQAAQPDPKPLIPPAAAVQYHENNSHKEEVKIEEPEWGEAVDGVQARLRPVEARWDTGAPPEFTLDLRNQGKKEPYQCRVPSFCMIEWDGAWYRWGGSGDLDCKSTVLEPGKQIDDWVKVSLRVPWIKGRAGTVSGVQPLEFSTGKHNLRMSYTFAAGEFPDIQKGLKTEVVPNLPHQQGIRVVTQLARVEVGKESAWGEAVEGVQSRIRTPMLVWGSNEAPTLMLDIRNLGKKTPDNGNAPASYQIEVDKVWYGWEVPTVSYHGNGYPLKPGDLVNNWLIIAPDGHWSSLAPEKKRLAWPPGKHTVRIAYELQGTKPPIRPVSGPLEIEISDKPSMRGVVTPPAEKAAPGAGPNESPAQRGFDIRKKLDEPITYQLAIDITLDMALDELLTRNGISWIVNDAAFGPGNKDIVKKTKVEKIDRVEGVTRGTVLNKLLAKISNNDCKTAPMYLIRPDRVEITTLQAYRDEFFPGRKGVFLPPLVYGVFDKVPLSDVFADLRDTTGGNVIVASYAAKEAETKISAEFTGVPLDTAVTLLADMADLQSVRVGNVYYVTTPERARRLEKEERFLKAEKTVPAKPQADDPAPKK